MDEAEMLSRVKELWLDVNYPQTKDLWVLRHSIINL